ncbi:cytochrome P450 family protein [Xylogone sp. PMI_703]|nr:cytochrome P450 family protein [Xylogone sp. PMI_703]
MAYPLVSVGQSMDNIMDSYMTNTLKHLRELHPLGVSLVTGLAIHLRDTRAVLLLAIAFAYILYLRYVHPLSKVPGPYLASITSLWWVYTIRQRQQHVVCVELHKTYGPLVRVTPNEILVADPKAFKIIYGAGNKFSKSDFYKPLQKTKFDLTTERDERVHATYRRLVGRAYSLDFILKIESFVDESIGYFLDRLRGKAGQEFNLGDWFQYYALDTVAEITFSSRFGYMERGEDDGVLALGRVFLLSAAWIGYMPWIETVEDVLSPIFGRWLGTRIRSTNFRGIAIKKIEEHKASEHKNHNDILSYLEHVHAEKPDQYSEADLRSTVMNNVFAAADTTASSLKAIFWYLHTAPGYEEKFRKELEERKRQGLLSDPVSYREAEAWPLLQAIIYEAIRLHSPFGTHLPRVVPEGGLMANGIYLPAGTTVGTNAWAIHRCEEIYGKDVEAFRPERWYDEKMKGDMQRYFFGFGGGSRTCIGRNIAWLEMSKLVPLLLMRFDVKILNPEKPMPIKTSFLAIQHGPEVILTPKQ